MSHSSQDLTGLGGPIRPEQAILSVSGLSFSYDGPAQAVLHDLSLEIPAGAVTAILGPNGSGKTTLLRLLLGVLRPATGAIELAGRPQQGYSRRERSQLMGLVPQDEHIPFDFSVLEYVLLGRAPYLSPLQMPGEADRRVALAALEMVGLDRLQDRNLPSLSGGERQLATLARALAQQPQVLLLDEPAAHLDLSNQGRLLALLRKLAAQGKSLVLTTHDPNLAASVASFVVLMREGRVLTSGLPEATLTAENLSATYDTPVQVLRVDGRRVILLS
ncbi:MAG: ABC transporter ATP-binding protein [Anaerolineae bacterium]|jgi:iron complex transport system ATP-binding protein